MLATWLPASDRPTDVRSVTLPICSGRFAHTLVYHARETPEREQLADFIRATVQKAEQTEVQSMGKPIAESLIEEGKSAGILEGKRRTLVRQLQSCNRNSSVCPK
jgi:hypothetical protein